MTAYSMLGDEGKGWAAILWAETAALLGVAWAESAEIEVAWAASR